MFDNVRTLTLLVRLWTTFSAQATAQVPPSLSHIMLGTVLLAYFGFRVSAVEVLTPFVFG